MEKGNKKILPNQRGTTPKPWIKRNPQKRSYGKDTRYGKRKELRKGIFRRGAHAGNNWLPRPIEENASSPISKRKPI